jgi:hypothetical protein
MPCGAIFKSRIRRWILIVLLVGAVPLALLLSAMLSEDSVRARDYDQVSIGMTKLEVTTLFRGIQPLETNERKRTKTIAQIWRVCDGHAIVYFDQQDRVVYKEWNSDASSFGRLACGMCSLIGLR